MTNKDMKHTALVVQVLSGFPALPHHILNHPRFGPIHAVGSNESVRLPRGYVAYDAVNVLCLNDVSTSESAILRVDVIGMCTSAYW